MEKINSGHSNTVIAIKLIKVTKFNENKFSTKAVRLSNNWLLGLKNTGITDARYGSMFIDFISDDNLLTINNGLNLSFITVR